MENVPEEHIPSNEGISLFYVSLEVQNTPIPDALTNFVPQRYWNEMSPEQRVGMEAQVAAFRNQEQ